MLPARILLDQTPTRLGEHFIAYAWYVMVMYLACDTFMENHLKTLDSTFCLKLMPENQGDSCRLTVYVQTP